MGAGSTFWGIDLSGQVVHYDKSHKERGVQKVEPLRFSAGDNTLQVDYEVSPEDGESSIILNFRFEK